MTTTLNLLERTGQLIHHGDGRCRLTPNLCVCASATGYFDKLDTSSNPWVATGWAIDFETRQSCADVLAIQNGWVLDHSSFIACSRPDVNAAFRLPLTLRSGITVSLAADPNCGRVSLLGVFDSGSVALLAGPGECAPANPWTHKSVTIPLDVWQQKFRKTLHAFPDSSPFCSLYSLDPAYDPRSYSGVTTQFLEQSDVYHAKFTDHRRWTYLLSQALFRLQLDESRDISVLDVGSGSGNSVYPMLTLLPTASIVATDISPQLLALLHKQLSVTDRQRVLAVAMDASQPFLARESFDLVVGAAILHHIMDPSTTLAACCDALKPTGHAIFFEPFETGYVLLRFLYEQLVNNSDRFRLPDTVRQVLQAIIVDITVRTGSDKTADLYKSLDDKWQFTRAYFERQRSQCGFSSLMIYPLDSPVGQFSAQLRTHLRLCLNAGPESVSDLVWEFVREFEGHFSPASAPERALEACVIFSR